MDVALIVIATLLTLSLLWFVRVHYHMRRDMQAWVEASITEAIRRQDDRIQKRILRSADEPETNERHLVTPRIGQPFHG